MTSDLHAAIEESSGMPWQRKLTLHFMLQTGRWDGKTCQMPNCKTPELAVDLESNGNAKYAAQIDHIKHRSRHGSSMPDNVRVVHKNCQMLNYPPDAPLWSEERKAALHAKLSVTVECPICSRPCRGEPGLNRHRRYSLKCTDDVEYTKAYLAQRAAAGSASGKPEVRKRISEGVKRYNRNKSNSRSDA